MSRKVSLMSWITMTLFLLITTACSSLWAQVGSGGTPVSFTKSLSGEIDQVDMPDVDRDALLAEDAQQPKTALDGHDPGQVAFDDPEDFESGYDGWTIYSVANNYDWERNSSAGGGANSTSYYMYCNAYNSDGAGNDWLISPSIDLSGYTNPQLDFYSWTSYTDTITGLEAKISTNYSGSGDPTSATWTSLSATLAPQDSETWTNSGDIDLSAYTGTVYIAFQYTSTGNSAGSSALWRVDEVRINSSSGVVDPSNFTATGQSVSQINLAWTANSGNDNVMVAYNTTDAFGAPSGSCNAGDPITGGGSVIYNGSATTYNHSGLAESATYYYKAWSVNGVAYSNGITANGTTLKNEPTNHPTNFMATGVSSSTIRLTWTDAAGTTSPDGYLIKASNVSFAAITNPADGSPVSDDTNMSDGVGAANVAQGSGLYNFSGLSATTEYFFKIYAYTNSGSQIDYKLDGTIPSDSDLTTSVADYYASAMGLSGQQLKDALHTIVTTSHTTNYSYSQLWDILSETDEDPNNSSNVLLFYTNRSRSKNAHGGGDDEWNREHTWVNSHGIDNNLPGYTDLHHLRPCDPNVNNARGSLDFDEGGSEYNDDGYATGCNYDGNSFEPPDNVKGDAARIIFYMAVRYEGTGSGSDPYDLEMVDNTNESTPSGSVLGVESTLLQWHTDDPVDTWEQGRNERIYSRQGNRNPFIDHPEWVNSVWGEPTTETTVQFSTAVGTVGEGDGTYNLSVTITNPDATSATTANVVLTNGSGTDIGDYTTQTVTFPAGSSTPQTVTITITDDIEQESSELFTFELQNVAGGNNASAGSPSQFGLTITDNDSPTSDVTPPVISNVQVSGITTTAATVGFDTDELATSTVTYGLTTAYGDSETSQTVATSHAISLTGLQSGTTYHYQVCAVDTVLNDTCIADGSFQTEDAGDIVEIVINEIFNNAVDSDDNREWFEVYNAEENPVDMDGWTIRDDDNDSHVIAGSLIVPAQGFAVLCQNGDTQLNGGNDCDYVYGNGITLSNSADEIVLIDSDGQIIDQVNYDGGPAFPDVPGISLSLVNPFLDNSVGENWEESPYQWAGEEGGYGTPGTINFIFGDTDFDMGVTEEDVVPILDNILLEEDYDIFLDLNLDTAVDILDIILLIDLLNQ